MRRTTLRASRAMVGRPGPGTDWYVAMWESSPGRWNLSEYRAASFTEALSKAPGRLGEVRPGRVSRRAKGVLS